MKQTASVWMTYQMFLLASGVKQVVTCPSGRTMSSFVKTFLLFVSLIGLGAWGGNANAAARFSVASGNWNSTAIWGTVCGGAGGLSVPGTADTATICTGTTVAVNVNTRVNALAINAGATLNASTVQLRVNTTTSVSGAINFTGAVDAQHRFSDAVTINAGGAWTDTSSSTFNFRAGGITNNGGTFTGGTGVYEIRSVNQAIGGSSPISIPSLLATTTITNTGNLTVGTALTGTTLVNSAAATLNLGGTSAITTLTANTAGNTVNYTGVAQTVKTPSGGNYVNLTLSGSGAKTVPTGLTVAGNFTLSGTATVAAPAALTVGGNFAIGTGNTFTPGTGTVTFNGAAAQTIGSTSPLNFNNLTVANGANPNITLMNNVSVAGALTGTVNLTSSCPTDYTLTSTTPAQVLHSCPIPPTPPTVTTNAASALTASGATLNGTVSSNGASTAVTFNYGLTTGYGSTATATPSPLATNAVNTAVSVAVAGLNCNTTYHFRVTATNSAGTTNGGDFTFTTSACVLGGVINTYYPGTASVTAGATSITLGAATGATTPITTGDMLLIMQMQDATIDSTNTATYGTVSAANSGLYEYVIAASNVPLGGGTLTLSCGTVNAYTNANYVAGSSGQKRYQVMRVPSYATASLTSTLTANAWNGSTGGILAFDVTGALALNSATVTVDGKGFRGGAVRTLAGGVGANTDYRTLATVNNNGSKGEGIAGTPNYLFTAPSTLTNTGVEGYPNGSNARGAPANGGGGGTDRNPAANDQNPGGGGGANGGAGGAGGIGWCPTFNAAAPPLYGCGPNSGGLGGNPVTGLGATRLTLGGGGGGGTANNITGTGACAAVSGLCSSGAAGGGIIMLRAGSMTGAGTFNANGSAGDSTVGNDGSGGGAGGVVLIKSGSGMGGATINANGGNGGSNLIPPLSSGPHGPGGGGGGGYVITSGAAAASSTASGVSGVTYNTGVLFGAYGATAGSAGSSNPTLTSTVGVALGATGCGPSGPDHYTISHSGTGITCEAEPVIFTAHDTSHARADANGKTLNIVTNSGNGTWLATSDSCTRVCYDTAGTEKACVNGFSNTVGNNGAASYTFASGESGIRLCLKQNSPVTQNINVSDGTASESSGAAEGGSDPNLAFSDTGIRFYADGNVDSIANQVAGVRNDDVVNYPGTTQALTVRALKSGATTPARCVPLLTSVTRTLQFAYRCESSPNTCSTSLPQGLEVNGTAVTGFDSTNTPVPNNDVAVDFDANGYGSINLKYFDVGNISLWARATSLADSTTGSTFAVVAGNSNTFAVKPYDFALIPCASSNPCTVAPADPGVGGGGGVFVKAVGTFNATVTARAFGGTKIYSFGRCDNAGGAGCAAASESISLTHALAAPSGGAPGTFGGTTSANASSFVTASGAYTFANLTWDEVGVITLKAANANYLANGFAACTTQTAGEKCQGTFGVSANLGRFIPDHFDTEIVALAGAPLPCPSELTCPANSLGSAAGMVYSGQAFAVRITAKNSALATTQNYQGDYAKTVIPGAWDALGGASPNPGGGALANVAASAFSLGVSTPTQTYTLPSYVAIPVVGPTDFYLRAVDSDNVSSLRSVPANSVEAGLKVAYGRIKVANAYGSELLPISLTAAAQYYGTSGWTNSLTDNVTIVGLASTYAVVPTTGTVGSTTPTPQNGVVTGGKLSIKLSKPGTKGVATITPAHAYMTPLAGTVTFGVYKGNNEFIYLREAY